MINSNDRVRENIDNIMWLLHLGTPSACKRALAAISDIRLLGNGWWDASIARLEVLAIVGAAKPTDDAKR